MNKIFNQLAPEEITENIFKRIGTDWMLITAGSIKSFNLMTASWGGFGVLWNKNICWCVIRPQRHTYSFMEKSKTFTLSFFTPKYKYILEYCGTHSGKDVNKAKETGLTPIETSHGSIYFEQANLIIEFNKSGQVRILIIRDTSQLFID